MELSEKRRTAIRKGQDFNGLKLIYRLVFQGSRSLSLEIYQERLRKLFPEMSDDVTDMFRDNGWIEIWKEAPPYQVLGIQICPKS